MSKKRVETKMILARIDPQKEADEYAASIVPPSIEDIIEERGQDYRKLLPRPRSRTFTAKPCSVCQALREPDTNYTRVYASRGNVRYCKCTYCNNTWKDSDG